MGRMADARKKAKSKGPATPTPPLETPSEGTPTRLSLPASGLAEEILSRPEAKAVPEETTALQTQTVAVSGPDPERAARVHNLSFFSSPVREERKAVEATEHLVTFFLSGEEYGIEVRLVQEIIRVTEITPIPRAPEFVRGVINLRGRIIPVVDLKRKLSLGEVSQTRHTRIVVVRLRERLIGLLVDGASQVKKIPVSSVEPAPEGIVDIDTSYIRGVAKLVDRLIILIDLVKILALELRETEVDELSPGRTQ